jgi:CYTH domain-containing protein
METPDPNAAPPHETEAPPPQPVTRKFLVGELPKTFQLGQGQTVENGYLCVEKDGPEIFIRRTDDAAMLCVRTDSALEHSETQVALTPEQVQVLWPLTESRRARRVSYRFTIGDIPMSLDKYEGRLNWLRIAEAEFKGRRAAEDFIAPPWLYREITDIIAYRNSNLSKE